MTHGQMQQLTNINLSWFDFIRITLSIKNYLKSQAINPPVVINRPLLPLNLRPILKSNKGCKDFYVILNNKC